MTGLAWWDRRQPKLIVEAARRAGCHSTPRVGQYLEIRSDGQPIMEARFSAQGSLLRAWSTEGHPSRPTQFVPSGLGLTPRETVDLIVRWFRLGRPTDYDQIRRTPELQPHELAAMVASVSMSRPEPDEHLPPVIDLASRRRK